MNADTHCPCCMEARVACRCGPSEDELSPEEWAAATVPNDPEGSSDCAIEIRVEASSCLGDPVAFSVLTWLNSVLKDQGHTVSAVDVQGDKLVGLVLPYDPKARPPVVPREFRIVRVMGKRPGFFTRLRNRYLAWRARKSGWPKSADSDGAPLFVRVKSRQMGARVSGEKLKPMVVLSSSSPSVGGKSDLRVMAMDEIGTRPSSKQKEFINWVVENFGPGRPGDPEPGDKEPPAAGVSPS